MVQIYIHTGLLWLRYGEKLYSQLYNLRIPTRRVGTKSEPILGGINTSFYTGATWDSNTKY
jgi:hypothetical protein